MTKDEGSETPMLHSATMKRRNPPSVPSSPAPVFLVWFCWSCLMLTLLACGPIAGPDEEVDKAEIQKILEGYLPVLGKAYAERAPQLLEAWAVPKEQARIQLRIDELEARGQVYEPQFKNVTVENISVWNYSNAFVTTVEVWDVRAYTVGSRMVVNESLDQRSRVKYQMKRKEDGWLILYRELEKTSDE